MRLSRSMTVAAAAAMLVAGSAASASAAPDEGVRDTDAPRVLRVGAPEQIVPVTVISGVPADGYEAAVGDEDEEQVFGLGVADGPEAGRPNVFKVPVDVVAEAIPAWGESTWSIVGYTGDPEDEAEAVVVAAATRPVDVRANSLLGLSVQRTGDTVAVTASARAFHSTEGRNVAYSGKTVSVQAFTGEYWKQVTGLTTDSRGNRTTFVRAPRGTAFRLVMVDAPTIWGAVSSTQKA